MNFRLRTLRDEILRKRPVVRGRKPRICLVVDKHNWAFDISAQEIAARLSSRFSFDIVHLVDRPVLRAEDYDLFHVFFWGERYHTRFEIPKWKILKEISSWRWLDDPAYGPCSPRQMIKRHCNDADYLTCTSVGLYETFKHFKRKCYLAENGFDAGSFRCERERRGEMRICWCGNIADPVKGVKDVLKPSCEGRFLLDLASDLPHSELARFYNGHDIYAISSRHEAEPLPLLESMACGCFPVCTAVGLVPELVRHLDNGYIVAERTPEAFSRAFAWCEAHLDYVRGKGQENAEHIRKTRCWGAMIGGFDKMYSEILGVV